MTCAGCGHDNRAEARFCEQCGTPLHRACSSCGTELRPQARFCDSCGTPVPAGPAADPSTQAAAGARKVVSVVFADLVGSTALQERVDAESARRLMERYYDVLRMAVEDHGGTVVKLLGDGVMAAFGVPQVSEDDAIRAVRAGCAMQEAFGRLAEQQAAVLAGAGLRVAVNTGEVVVSDDNDDIVGDPVNVAARLQEEAGDGEVVIGEATLQLVADLVTLAPLGSFALKGRTGTVTAHRVVSLERPAGSAATPFVGREAEIARLAKVFEAASAEPAARMAVLLGSPGLGKSRLIGELGRRLADKATVIHAHCDAAGGATFAPLADALRDHLEIDETTDADGVRTAVAARVEGEEAERRRIVEGVAAVIAGEPSAPEETFYVVRRLLASMASEKPVVLVVDDLQWGEPLLLDLIEHLIQWGGGVPLLVLVGARPELRELRSSLTTSGSLISDVITLSGLDAGAATQLAAHVIGATDLPSAVAAKVLASSEGNPLFVGELVRMLVHEGILAREGERWVVGEGLASFEMPPTIHALLAARIERLRPEERTILERAAVVGRHFSRGAIAELLPESSADLDARLEALRRTELIERDTGWFIGEPGLRFHHALVRDAAYRRLLKETRADLHSRCAEWIERKAGKSAEHDETIGWHFEQAHQLLGELGPLDQAGRRLGERAAARLAAAGRRALAGDDVALAANLLGRALARADKDGEGLADLLLDACEAQLSAGDVPAASAAIEELGVLSSKSERLQAWYVCFVGQLTSLTEPESLHETVDAVAAAAEQLATLDDKVGEAKAHFVHAQALARLGKVGACEAALDRALAAARTAGDRRRANAVLAGAPLAALWGPSPVTRASGRCLDVVRVLRITQGAPAVEAVALSCQGVLEALRGRTDAARRMIASSRAMVEELGISASVHETDTYAARVDLLEGDAAAAENRLRGAYEGLRDLGLGIDAARAAALLARCLLRQDRAAEAEELSHESERLAGDDLQAAIAWRGVRAEALARRGETDKAVVLASAAVEIAATTDALLDHADARLALAAALRAAGRGEDAGVAERRAHELWVEKGASLLATGRDEDVSTAQRGRGAAQQATVESAAGRRPLPRTSAVEVLDAANRALAERDIGRIEQLHSRDYHDIEHSTGAEHGYEFSIRSVRSLMEHEGATLRMEPLATLGDRLVLLKRMATAPSVRAGEFDVGPIATDHFCVVGVDDGGLFTFLEAFAPERGFAALARLFECYGEEEPSESEPCANQAKLFRAIDDVQFGRLAELANDDVAVADHRTVGFEELRGLRATRAVVDSLVELADGLSYRLDDVRGLTRAASYFEMTSSGVTKASGGAFERSLVAVVGFDSEGRVKSLDNYDAAQEDAARARFDELAGTREKPRASSRRVEPNDAVAACGRWLAGVNGRDLRALADVLHDEIVVTHHPTGVSYGKAQTIDTWNTSFESATVDRRPEFLATLGRDLVLGRHATRFSEFENEGFDIGEAEIAEAFVARSGGQGRLRRIDLFAPEKLGEAVALIYGLHAESLPPGAERDRADTTARLVAMMLTDASVDSLDELGAPDIEAVDHRLVGHAPDGGADFGKRFFDSWEELTEERRYVVEDVLALTTDALLRRTTVTGKLREGGGDFETSFLALSLFDELGRHARIEVFEPDCEADALARLDELTENARAGGASPFANASWRATERMMASWDSCDWSAIECALSPNIVYDDRRRLSRVKVEGLEAALSGLKLQFELPNSRHDVALLATRGDRLHLSRSLFSSDVPAGGGPADGAESLRIFRTNSDGLIDLVVSFCVDDEEAAYAELERLWDEGEAKEHPQAAQWVRRWWQAFDGRDWDAIAQLVSDQFVACNHRMLSWETLRGGDEWSAAFRELTAMSSDVRSHMQHLRVCDRGIVLHSVYRGTREGGSFEIPYLAVGELDEGFLAKGIDVWDLDKVDDALARFAEIEAGGRDETARRYEPSNPATASLQRWVVEYHRACQSGDWSGLWSVAVADLVYDDRQRVSQIVGDLDLAIASARERGEQGGRFEDVEILGVCGDRLAVCRCLIAGGSSDGRFENELLAVFEVNDSGLATAIVLFDAEDREAALHEMWARWETIDPLAERWTETAAMGNDAYNRRDVEVMREFYAESVVVVDHRLAGFGRTEGREQLLDALTALWKLAPDVRVESGWSWLAYDERVSLATALRTGTTNDGAEFVADQLSIVVMEDGHCVRFEIFETEHVDRAMARYEELRASAPDAPTRIPPNLATETADRVRALLEAGDIDRAIELIHPDMRGENRRRLFRMHNDYDVALGNIRWTVEGGWSGEVKPLATAGDRLALHRSLLSRSHDGARDEIEFISLGEVDADGRVVFSVIYDPEDVTEAAAELQQRRHDISDGQVPDGSAAYLRAWNSHDPVRMRAMLRDDYVHHDRRRTGIGLVEDVDRYVATLEELWKLGAGIRLEFLYEVAAQPHGFAYMSRWRGTSDDGVDFESVFVAVAIIRDGLIRRIELFEPEEAGQALARFEELRPGSPPTASETESYADADSPS